MIIDRRHRVIKKITITGAIVNCLLAASQIVFGIIGHSQALLADGFHTLSDLLSDFIVLFAVKQSSAAADEGHPYGHGRIETLATVLLGFLLVIAGLGIGYRGISSIVSSQQSNPALITLVFAGLAIFAKEFLYRYTIKAAKQVHSNLLESNAWHHRSDALSSVVVLVGISAQLLGVPYMDILAAILVAIMIIVMGLRLTSKAFAELIDTSLDIELVGQVKSLIEGNESVREVHSLRSRSMGGLGYVDAEIRVNPRLTVSEAHYIAFSLERAIKATFEQIIDVSIHVDPLTESGHDSVIELPPRTEIEGMLAAAWQDLPCSDQIEQIHLHYLRSQVEIDIILPGTLAKTEYGEQIDQLIDKAVDLKHIGKVNIYFSR
ncbi:MAG: cation diffusion facilitator family transporter [Gammaproteobacteria bacterium]|nr:cation diffusion facilitator family transporter [Gammaproteobacteria bacterium]